MKLLDFSVLHHIFNWIKYFYATKIDWVVCTYYVCAKLCAKTDCKRWVREGSFFDESQSFSGWKNYVNQPFKLIK